MLAMTGWRIGAGDMLAAGIAPLCIESDAAAAAMRAIITATDPDAAVAAIKAMAVSPDDTPLLDAAEWISGHFGKDDVMAIRQGLDAEGFSDVMIMSYAAKYASCFYGPFRNAVGAGKTAAAIGKDTYQMDPANSDEAMREIAIDIAEGADLIIIKPGMPYLDIIQRATARFEIPIIAYQVSGEYAMIETAAAAGHLDRDRAIMETLTAFRRAGADAIMTYHAAEVAERLQG